MGFHHCGLRIRITGFHDEVLEFIRVFIQVFIHGATLLEIGVTCMFYSIYTIARVLLSPT